MHRALNFVKYLPANGWSPTVLTSRQEDYPAGAVIDLTLLDRLPAGMRIVRARHLRVPGLLRGWLLPDDKVGWWPAAVSRGWRIMRSEAIEAILATGGPWTSFLVAWTLSLLTGAHLILDYRDPWTDNPYRRVSWIRRRIDAWLERLVLRRSSGVVLNTPDLRARFVARFPELPPSQLVAITNGYDPALFADLPRAAAAPRAPMVIAHTGHLYRTRNPEPFLRTVRQMLDSGELVRDDLRIRFVGEADFDLAEMVRLIGLEQIVSVEPQVSHPVAMRVLAESNALLLIQTGSPLQIPAKLYEYLAYGKPVLTLTDEGATRNLVTTHRLGVACSLDDDPAIRRSLLELLAAHRDGGGAVARGDAESFRVDTLTRRLAEFCNACVDRPSAFGDAAASGS